jgi:hypothetical protein
VKFVLPVSNITDNTKLQKYVHYEQKPEIQFNDVLLTLLVIPLRALMAFESNNREDISTVITGTQQPG